MPTEHVLIESGDRDDAENLSSLVGHPNLQDSVHPNHQFTHEDVSIGQDATVTVSGGKAFIGYHGAANGNQALQTSTGEDRREGLFVVEKASNEAVDLAQVDGENYLWLDAQIGTGDSPQWVMTTSNTQPAEGSLLIAKYLATDEDGDSVTEDIQHIGYYNRGADVVADSISGGTNEEISLDESSLIDAGHDAVDVPQTVERTVADFEGGTLPQDAVGDTGDASVQSTVALEGDYSLKIAPSSDASFIYLNNRDIYPQSGDTVTYRTQLTDTNDLSYFTFGSQNSTDSIDEYQFLINAKSDKILLIDRFNGNVIKQNADISSRINETLYPEIEWSLDGDITATLRDSTDSVIATVSLSPSTLVDSGLVGFKSLNRSTPPTTYFDGVEVNRRETEARTNTKKGTTQLGNEVVPSGSIQTGPTTSSTNAERAIYQDAPVDNNVTQGTQSKLTLLQSGLNPAMFMERTLDGQGGAYGHQLQAPLGRFARLNANLSWEYDSLSDVGEWSSDNGGTSSWTFNINSYPRRIHVEHDGSGGSDDWGNVKANVLTNPTSLGGFAITFHDVSFTQNDGANTLRIGITDSDTRLHHTDNGLYYSSTSVGQNDQIVESDVGSTTYNTYSETDWSTNHDITLAVTATEATIFIDGQDFSTKSHDLDADFSPAIEIKEDAGSSSGEVVEVQQVSVEPLPEVLQ